MDADQALGCLAAHRVGDAGAHVAALGHVAGVAESTHELGPGPCRPAQIPAHLDRLAGEPVPGQGGQHEMEGILGAAAVRGRVRQRADGVEQLDHGAGPAVRHDQRQRVLVLGLDVDEVDLHAVDLGRELRQRVQLRLGLAPVVLGRPVARERLKRRRLHTLRAVVDELLAGPARRSDAPTQLGKLLFRDLDVERTDVDGGLDGRTHEDLRGWCRAGCDDLRSRWGDLTECTPSRRALSNTSSDTPRSAHVPSARENATSLTRSKTPSAFSLTEAA